MLRHEERGVFFDALAALMIVPEGMGLHGRPPSKVKTGVPLFTAKLELSVLQDLRTSPSVHRAGLTGQQCQRRVCLPQDGTDYVM
jgi:hypothetical protein